MQCGSMNPLEKRLKYKFRNPLLLAEAMTHPSLGHETQRHHFDNQRLEFLGDAVLQLIFTEWLFDHFKTFSEGQLTKLRSRLVSREGLTTHALRIGLVTQVVAPEKLREQGLEIARTIASKGPVAVRLTKQIVQRGQDLDLVNACQQEAYAFGLTCATADQKEGMQAFLEKRAAKFTGR